MSKKHPLSLTPTRWVLVLLALASLAPTADLRPEDRLALEAFDRELQVHMTAARGGRAIADPERMVKAARDRRVVLRRLVRDDPEQAVTVALDRTRRALVPAAARSELEEEISGMGALEILISRPLVPSDPPIVLRHAVVAGQRYLVTTWGGGLQEISASRRSLHGVAVDGVLALAPGRLRVLKAGETPLVGKRLDDQRCPVSGKVAGDNQEPDDAMADVVVESGDAVHVLCQGGHLSQLGDQIAVAEAGSSLLASAWTTGPKQVLYIIAQCADETAFPESVSDANNTMTQVAARFAAQSWGQTTMTYKVVQVLLPKTKAEYLASKNSSGNDNGVYVLQSDARSAATALDPDNAPANWDLDCIRHAGIWGWGGLGSVGGKGTWLQGTGVGLAVHELGHNYGLMHANFWETGGASVIGAGSNDEYGDPFSEMGGNGQFTAFEKWRLEWIPTANVQTITTSGTYRVDAGDSATAPAGSAKYALRIAKDGQRDYWISHRREFSSNAWTQDGVFLHWDPWSISGIGNSNGGGQLLDTTPGSVGGKSDAALVRGRTFADTAANVYITPMTLNTGTTPVSMNVVVNIGPFPTNRRPTVTVTANATSVATGATVDFTASASDPDGDPLAIHWDFADQRWAANTLTPTQSWNTAKVYPVRVTVSDMKGGTASDTVLITVGTVSTFRIAGNVRGPGAVGLEGVRVSRAGSTTPVWSDSDGSYTLANVAAGTHTVAVQKDGFIFTADSTATVTVGPNATGIDFSASNAAPTVVTPAGASSSPVTAKTVTLSALGADDGGEASLTYTWTVTGSPPAPVTFAPNGTNAAKTTLATFAKTGGYEFLVTISDAGGLTATSTVAVTVNQTSTMIVVSPSAPVVHVGSTRTFTALANDQFARALSSQPSFTWSVSGGKSISASGVVAASTTVGGPYTVTASGGGRSGTSTFTVVNDAPTIAAIADLATAPGIATGAIAVTIADTETAAGALILTRASSDPALLPVANIVMGGTGANRTVTLTPTAGATGAVTVTMTVADAHGASTVESFVLTVGTPPAGSGGGDGGGGGGGGCGLGGGVSALLALLALSLSRFRRLTAG